MKKAISFCVIFVILIQILSLSAFEYVYATDQAEESYVSWESCVSENEKYTYYKNNGRAGFRHSFETDITVLEIPEEIDGNTLTSVSSASCDSPSLVRIKYPDSVKEIGRNGLDSGAMDLYKEPIPICMLDINEGVESISAHASGSMEASPDFANNNDDVLVYYDNTMSVKTLILPSTLKHIGMNGIARGYCENIIFQSNPKTEINSVTYMDGEYYREKYKTSDPLSDINYYFTGDATNLSEFTFNYTPYWLDETYSPFTFPSKGVTIYKKPGAQGFEKFLEFYEEEYSPTYGELEEGFIIPEYTVKEYTEEWWHDLAEIEEVTMTAEGMSEKTEQVGNGLSDSARKYLSHEYEKSVKSGEKFTVSSAFAPSDAYDDRTFFVSMDETVATVDTETGEVTALKKGTARIRCVAASGVFSDCILKVDGGDNTNGVYPLTNYYEKTIVAKETTLSNEVTTDPDLSANQTKTTDWKEFFFANKLYIIIPVAAAAILTAAVVVIKKKKR